MGMSKNACERSAPRSRMVTVPLAGGVVSVSWGWPEQARSGSRQAESKRSVRKGRVERIGTTLPAAARGGNLESRSVPDPGAGAAGGSVPSNCSPGPPDLDILSPMLDRPKEHLLDELRIVEENSLHASQAHQAMARQKVLWVRVLLVAASAISALAGFLVLIGMP